MTSELFTGLETSSHFEGKQHLIASIALQSIFNTQEEMEIALNEMMSE